MHEHTKKYEMEVQGSSDRVFGFVFGTVFLIIGLAPLQEGSAMRHWALAAGLVILLIALCIPKVLAPANALWTKFGIFLHGIVSPVALGILFFFVVTPTALLMRALRKDPLRLRFDANADSYWIKRDPPGPDPKSLNNQF